MTVDELVRRFVVAVVAPALGQHVLFVRLQHRELLDLPKVTGEARSGRYVPVSGRQPTHDVHLLSATPKQFRNEIINDQPHSQLISIRYYFAKEVIMPARK